MLDFLFSVELTFMFRLLVSQKMTSQREYLMDKKDLFLPYWSAKLKVKSVFNKWLQYILTEGLTVIVMVHHCSNQKAYDNLQMTQNHEIIIKVSILLSVKICIYFLVGCF